MKNTRSHARRSLPGCGSHDRRIQPRDAVAARNIRARRLAQTIVICLATLFGSTSDAGIVITFEESGTDVVATLSGSFASLPTPTTGTNVNFGNRVMASSQYVMWTPIGGSYDVDQYRLTNSLQFGTGGFFPATSSANVNTQMFISGTNLFIPDTQNYVGTVLTGSLTWANHSFSTLGLTPGSYSTTFFNDASESVTINVGAQPVPEPASYLATLGVGAACWIAVRRRRRSR